MSKWREIASEVKAEGEARRGNFSPEPGSWPDRSYRYWRDAQWDPPQRENFCHFWRVAVIWSPVLRVRRFFRRNQEWIVGGLIGLAVVGILGTLAWVIISDDNTMMTLGWIGAVIAVMLYVLMGISMGVYMADPEEEMDGFQKTLAVLSAPVSVLVYGFVRFVDGAPGRWLARHGLQIVMGLLLGGLALFLGFVAYDLISSNGAAGVFYVGFIVAFLFTVAWVARNGGDWVAGWRARKERIEAERYEKWLAEFENENDTPQVESVPRKPTWVGRKVRAAGDLLILIGQVVRVNKWKICPYVTIVDDTTEIA